MATCYTAWPRGSGPSEHEHRALSRARVIRGELWNRSGAQCDEIATLGGRRSMLGETETPTLRGYLAVLWRRKLILMAAIVLCGAAGAAISARQKPMYQSSAQLPSERDASVRPRSPEPGRQPGHREPANCDAGNAGARSQRDAGSAEARARGAWPDRFGAPRREHRGAL